MLKEKNGGKNPVDLESYIKRKYLSKVQEKFFSEKQKLNLLPVDLQYKQAIF